MTKFRFLHSADIHLDSPLRGLARYEGLPLDRVRRATRMAFDGLIEAALEKRVDFVVLAGDLFDGDWKDMSTGLYFVRSIGRLEKAKIPVFIVKGNHDAASVVSKDLPLPEGVKVFDSRKAETFELEELGVALHGRSFPKQQVTEDLATNYPKSLPGRFNIGVLHTALTGYPPHANYAPCSPAELAAKGYDYWALGHVHNHMVVQETPHIVFPGNLQGRNIRETGVKGAVLVEVQDNAVIDLVHLPFDVLRWAQCDVDCAGVDDMTSFHDLIRRSLANTHNHCADGRPMVARVICTGATPLHGELEDRQEQLREDIRALAAHIDSDLWIEKLMLNTRMPEEQAPSVLRGDEFSALLDESAHSSDLHKALADDLRNFLASFPHRETSDLGPLLAAAHGENWQQLLRSAGAALRARLTQDEN